MRISEQTQNELNALLRKSFECNAMADNLAYCMDFFGYKNISKLYHETCAHKFPEWADRITDFMSIVGARAVRLGIPTHDGTFSDIVSMFAENEKIMNEYVKQIKDALDSVDMYDDAPARIFLEDFLMKVLPYAAQAEAWSKFAAQYSSNPITFDVHFEELTTYIAKE